MLIKKKNHVPVKCTKKCVCVCTNLVSLGATEALETRVIKGSNLSQVFWLFWF